jgi:hypothetical protein
MTSSRLHHPLEAAAIINIIRKLGCKLKIYVLIFAHLGEGSKWFFDLTIVSWIVTLGKRGSPWRLLIPNSPKEGIPHFDLGIAGLTN